MSNDRLPFRDLHKAIEKVAEHYKVDKSLVQSVLAPAIEMAAQPAYIEKDVSSYADLAMKNIIMMMALDVPLDDAECLDKMLGMVLRCSIQERDDVLFLKEDREKKEAAARALIEEQCAMYPLKQKVHLCGYKLYSILVRRNHKAWINRPHRSAIFAGVPEAVVQGYHFERDLRGLSTLEVGIRFPGDGILSGREEAMARECFPGMSFGEDPLGQGRVFVKSMFVPVECLELAKRSFAVQVGTPFAK